MSERKVLSKYYPPDFDPSAITRTRAPKKAGPKVQTVRLMSPFSMQCVSCGEFIGKGRKHNARKETREGERYLGERQIFRFYIRCTRCSAEIVFRTDPKNGDYVVERGAKRSTEPWRRGREEEIEETDEQRLDRIEREMAEMDGEGAEDGVGGGNVNGADRDAMQELEEKTAEAKREMAVADALDEIRTRNARLEKAKRDGDGELEAGPLMGARRAEAERLRQEKEDAEEAKRVFALARMRNMAGSMEGLEGSQGDNTEAQVMVSTAAGKALDAVAASMQLVATTSATATSMASHIFKRQVKQKKDRSALLGIKKKI